MSTIVNDAEFRKALDGFTLGKQREIGAAFVDEVVSLNQDDRVKRALDAARHVASQASLTAAFKGAKRASIESHARCGSEGDWSEQAAYFVARAAAVCSAPPEQLKNASIAWQAAINSRMARTCQSIDAAEDVAGEERERQYRVLDAFLKH